MFCFSTLFIVCEHNNVLDVLREHNNVLDLLDVLCGHSNALHLTYYVYTIMC